MAVTLCAFEEADWGAVAAMVAEVALEDETYALPLLDDPAARGRGLGRALGEYVGLHVMYRTL